MSCWIQIPEFAIAEEVSNGGTVTLPVYIWTPYTATASFFGYFTDASGENTTTPATLVVIDPGFTGTYGLNAPITGNKITITGAGVNGVIGDQYPSAHEYPGEAFQYLGVDRHLTTYPNLTTASSVGQIGLTEYYPPTGNLIMSFNVSVTSPTSISGGSVTDIITIIQPLAPRAHYIIEELVPAAVSLGAH